LGDVGSEHPVVVPMKKAKGPERRGPRGQQRYAPNQIKGFKTGKKKKTLKRSGKKALTVNGRGEEKKENTQSQEAIFWTAKLRGRGDN